MEEIVYIHGVDREEQERLAGLNRLTNGPFLKFLELKSADSVLEVGSGLGILAAEVALRVPDGEVVGIEYAPAQLAMAFRQKEDHPNLEFVQGDAHRLPFVDGRFEVVYCRYVLEHLHDAERAVQEVYRVLKPGGRFFVQENDTLLTVFDPDCPATDRLIAQFVLLQQRLGGDGRIGKRLFGLLKRAGFGQVTLSLQPEIHTADMPTFRIWVENILSILQGANSALLQQGLATDAEIAQATDELHSLLTRHDASALFHWNRVIGVKRLITKT